MTTGRINQVAFLRDINARVWPPKDAKVLAEGYKRARPSFICRDSGAIEEFCYLSPHSVRHPRARATSMGHSSRISMLGPREPLRCSPHTPKGASGEDGTATTSNSVYVGMQHRNHILRPKAQHALRLEMKRPWVHQFDARAWSLTAQTIVPPLMHRHVHGATIPTNEQKPQNKHKMPIMKLLRHRTELLHSPLGANDIITDEGRIGQ